MRSPRVLSPSVEITMLTTVNNHKNANVNDASARWIGDRGGWRGWDINGERPVSAGGNNKNNENNDDSNENDNGKETRRNEQYCSCNCRAIAAV